VGADFSIESFSRYPFIRAVATPVKSTPARMTDDSNLFQILK
jgi:hypothetical protein